MNLYCRHHPYGIRRFPKPRYPLGDISVNNSYFGNYQTMNGSNALDFHVNFIALLNKVFQDDTMNFLSEDQKDFVSTFLYEAGEVNDALNLVDVFNLTDEQIKQYQEEALGKLSETMRQLDSVLSQIELPVEELKHA